MQHQPKQFAVFLYFVLFCFFFQTDICPQSVELLWWSEAIVFFFSSQCDTSKTVDHGQTGARPQRNSTEHPPIAMFTGPIWGPPGSCRPQMGPMLAPWNLKSPASRLFTSTVYSDANQRKHQSSASLAFVRGIHRGPVNSPRKWPVTRKMSPFDDVIICSHILYHRIVNLLCTCYVWIWIFLISFDDCGSISIYDFIGITAWICINICIKSHYVTWLWIYNHLHQNNVEWIYFSLPSHRPVYKRDRFYKRDS